MEQEGWNRPCSTKNAKSGTEWDDRSSTQNRTEQERNDRKKGTRTERNDFKKVGTCPALVITQCLSSNFQCMTATNFNILRKKKLFWR